MANSRPLVFRQVLDTGAELLKERFVADEPIEDLVRDRARLVDIALRAAWVRHAGKFAGDLALVAVGGYGRGELHPSSDIDIMVLLPKSDSADWQSDIEKFLTFLWDIGLEVGHSVRSIDDCQRESLADISVATTLFEARLLAGPEALFAGMRRALAPDRLWSSQDFFEAKVKEQTERHHRYFDTAYNLEPNVKSSPGGLRDIQTIGWVAKRRFGTDTLDELVGARLFDARGAAQTQSRAILPVEGAVRSARADGPARRPPAVRLSDQAGKTVRLRGCELHARGRTAHAEVLPYRHGRELAQRNAAAAVSRGDPHAKRSARCPSIHAFKSATITWKSRTRRFSRAIRRRCWSCSSCCSSIRSCAACVPKRSA